MNAKRGDHSIIVHVRKHHYAASTLASRTSSRTLSRALNASIVGGHNCEQDTRNANHLQRAINCRFLAVASKEVRGVATHCSGRRGEPNGELTGTVGVVRVRVLIKYGVDRREVFGTYYKCLRKARNIVECFPN
jgi:hypothetical protein